MLIKNIISCDTVNYKKISMYVAFPHCTFKCDKENKCKLCQNRGLDSQQSYDISVEDILKYYDSSLVHALVCAGLEPLDSFEDLLELISEFRKLYSDDIVIYTGYLEEEIEEKLKILKTFSNIILKVGRFRPNQLSHFDDVLGVKLASPNQYAKKIS